MARLSLAPPVFADLVGAAADPLTTLPGAALRVGATAHTLQRATGAISALLRKRVAAVEAAEFIIFAIADALPVLAFLVGAAAEAIAAVPRAALPVRRASDTRFPADASALFTDARAAILIYEAICAYLGATSSVFAHKTGLALTTPPARVTRVPVASFGVPAAELREHRQEQAGGEGL